MTAHPSEYTLSTSTSGSQRLSNGPLQISYRWLKCHLRMHLYSPYCQLVSRHFPLLSLPSCAASPWWQQFWTWASQWLSFDVVAILATWTATFSAVVKTILGFGSLGVIKGSAPAFFQSTMYGAFTPAGGFFALLTGWGMPGKLKRLALLLGAGIATVAAGIMHWFLN